jgi:D-glycero-alpha-D-manno-heptose-7-phosphate kinase
LEVVVIIQSTTKNMGGKVVSTSIDKRVYVSLKMGNQFSEFKYNIFYKKFERCDKIEDIKHPAIRCILQHFDIRDSLEIHIISDLPAKTGLGSSSAFTVAFLKALYIYIGQIKTNYEIAMDAIFIEQKIIGDQVGSQDQYASALGGFNVINFYQNGLINHEPLDINNENLRKTFSSLLLIFTGSQRYANAITNDQINAIKNDKIKNETIQLESMVERGSQAILNGDIEGLGLLLDESWKIKRNLTNKISNTGVDHLYDLGKKNGAIGGKLLGAGGGGFLLFVVPSENKHHFIRKMGPKNIIGFAPDKSGAILHIE